MMKQGQVSGSSFVVRVKESWSKLEEGVEYVSRWIRQALMAHIEWCPMTMHCTVGWMRAMERRLSVLTHLMLDNPAS
jgi:hypothetical protein